jgi:ribose/xylose/arabinose/galactoside ABC-type transport system permease subunit
MTDPSAPVPPRQPATAAPVTAHLRPYIASIVWEAILLVAAIVALLITFVGKPSPPVNLFLSTVTPLGLLAVAVALSLRTATPNLAVGSLAALTGSVGIALSNGGMPLAAAMAIGVLIAGLAGLVFGVVVAALSVPAWAVTLAAATIIEAAVLGATKTRLVPLNARVGALSPLWFILFVLLTLGGGALFLIPGVRRMLSATRDVEPAGRWGGMQAGLGAVVGLTGSGLLAGIAGVAYSLVYRSSPVVSQASLAFAALGVALLGGVSIFGRRAGVAGVLLAAIFVGALQEILLIHHVEPWVTLLLPGIVLLVGLAASRLVESLGGNRA